MGLGYHLSEKICYDEKTGEVLTDSLHHYPLVLNGDTPQEMSISFKEGSFTTEKLLGAKGNKGFVFCLDFENTYHK